MDQQKNAFENIKNMMSNGEIVQGIGLVNCIYINPETKEFWLIDYRIFDPVRDGKSKVHHLQDILKLWTCVL